MSLTITIPGAVNVTTGATAPATLTVGVGVPGATGHAGPGVPAGGTAGQFLQKIDGVSYNTDWVTLNLSSYAPLASPALTGTPTAPTATSGDSSTQIATTAFVQDAVIAGSAHAETLQATVRNNTGATLAPFTVVYINGALGNQATVAKAQANAESTSAGTFAVTQASIANNANGVVISAGVLSNIDTSAFTDGDKLYLSPTTAGGVTTTKPSAPNHLVYVGVVTRSHPTLGTVSVRIQNGYELGEIHDVALASVTDNDLLAYESASGLWKNESFTSLGLLTSATAASTYQTQAGMSSYLTTASAASTYYLQTNPAGYITSSALSTYAPLASPALTGVPTSTTAAADTNTTQIATTAFVVGQASSSSPLIDGTATIGTSLKYARADHVHPTDTTRAALSGATFTGLVTTVLSATTGAGFNLPHGAAPTTPVNGDVWTTTSGLFARINGGTQQYAPLGSTNTFTGTNTFSGSTVSVGTSTAASTYNIGTGATLTATTKAINIGTNGVSGSTTNITIGNSISGATSTTTVAGTLNATGTSLDLGNSTAAATYNFGAGATLTATTKSVNIGTNGVAGSTTNIAIGSTTGTSTTTLQGTTNAVTAAQNTNTTQVATTAFVLGQASSTTPVVNGTAAVGTATTFARADHVHPTDTSRAALASPTFTGTPAAPTAAVDTNTTQIATTAYVVGQGYLKSATASSTYAPLASPALTGTPTAPTATAGTNTTQIATTAFVTTAVPAQATVAQSRSASSTTVSQNPSTTLWQSINPGFIQITHAGLGYTATGTMGGTAQGYYGARMTMGTAGAASANYRFSGASFDSGYICMSKGYRSYIDFSRYTRISGRFYTEDTWTDPQLTAAVYYGKAANSSNGDLARAGFGWKLSGNATASLRNPVLQVHNGTTLTNVTTSFALVAQQYFDWDIISDGTGNVTLFINGTQYATTSAGPNADTSYSGTSPMIWSEEFISTGTTAAYNATFGRGAIYVAQ